MKLPFPFFQKNKDEESEYYLALLLTDEKISAVILQQTLGKLRIVGKNEEFYSGSLETVGLEELIDLIDKTVSTAEEILPPNIETHKTVFGVIDSWVERDTKKIKKDFLARLKKVCDSLDLAPVGFMVINEAISNLLQQEEGAPLSAIVAEAGRKRVTLTLFRGGKVAESIDGPVEENTAETVDKLLKHFTTAVLPARIIIYDSKDTEKLAQQFISHQWSKSLPFLHVPQITPLPEGTDARAVVFGAATQMGFEVLGMDVVKEPVLPKDHHVEHDAETEDETAAESEEATDADEEEPKESPKHAAESTEPSTITSDNFGFVSDEDVAEIKLDQEQEPDKEPFHATIHQDNFETVEKPQDEPKSETRGEKNSLLTGAMGMLSSLRLPKFSLPAGGGNKRFIFPAIVLAALIIFGGLLYYFYTYNVKATIVLSVKPKIVDESQDITFSPTGSSDFSKEIIATKAIETTVSGSMSTATTGKKDVGNKAKGSVTIYNNGDSSVKLTSGTAIKSSNGLIFLLDKDVSVASASGDIFSGTKPGTTDDTVTAKDIGTDSNLPSGTKFSIGSNADLAAKNDNAFSGGSKKQVQVVSKNDVAKLRSDLPKSLEDKANADISQKTSGDEALIPLIEVLSLDNQKFDKDIDDEAKTVKLTANVKFAGQTYQKDEMTDFAKSLLKSKYSEDLTFVDKSITTSIKDAIEGKNNQVGATLVVSAGLLPNINTGEVIKNAQNKSLKETTDMLSGLPQVVEAKINYSPNVFFLSALFSHLPRQVTIEVKPE